MSGEVEGYLNGSSSKEGASVSKNCLGNSGGIYRLEEVPTKILPNLFLFCQITVVLTYGQIDV